jgi:hypothetical protein
MDIKFTAIKSVYDNKILDKHRYSMSWEKFVKINSYLMITPNKEDAPLISPVEYMTSEDALDFTESGDVRRCADNIKLWWMIGIDIDGQMKIEEAKERFKDFEYFLYTTHSHKSEKKHFTDCFRIFILLETPITNEDFLCRKNALQEFIGSTDLTTLARSRGFYTHSCNQENAHHAAFFYSQGQCLDALSLPVTIEIPYTQDISYETPSYEFKQKILEQLGNLFQIEYEMWWKICSAMQNAGYSLSEFEQLSNTIRSHRKNNCKAQWNCSKRKQIPLGYLINLCIENFGSGCLSMVKVGTHMQMVDALKKRMH